MIGALVTVAAVAAAAGILAFRDGFGTASSTDAGADGSTTSQQPSPSNPPQTSTSGSPSPSPSTAPSGNVEPEALPSLLESIAVLNETYKANLIPAADLATQPFSGLKITPAICGGAILPGIDYVYRIANYTGFAGQILNDDVTRTKVMQAVISFSTETEATRFYNNRFSDWKFCSDTTVTAEGGGTHSEIHTGTVADVDGIGTLTMGPAGEPPAGSSGALSCEHAMTPQNNVIIDVRVCAPQDSKSLGANLATRIASKITGTP